MKKRHNKAKELVNLYKVTVILFQNSIFSWSCVPADEKIMPAISRIPANSLKRLKLTAFPQGFLFRFI